MKDQFLFLLYFSMKWESRSLTEIEDGEGNRGLGKKKPYELVVWKNGKHNGLEKCSVSQSCLNE